jgi:hypothetical protein
MRGNVILASAGDHVCAKLVEGILSDPSGLGVLPGTHIQIKAAEPEVMGRLTWQRYDTAADGKPRMIAVLRENYLVGADVDTPYQDGDRIFLAIPWNGCEVNIRVGKGGTGTGDAIAIGDTFMVDDGTGVAIPDSSGDRKPWQAMEHVDDVLSVAAGGGLVLCYFTGG